MNKSNFSNNKYEEEFKYEKKERYVNRSHQNKKREFWDKVQQIRFNHRDRSKYQEALGLRRAEEYQVPLNKQMGFKSILKIGKQNPSKKINESQVRRVSFYKHAYGSECNQGDQMKFKKFIDLSEVQCQGFNKIIYVKKGWTPTITRMVTVVCCPSYRSKIEKALVRIFDDREKARYRGRNSKDLWTEIQHNYQKEINAERKHFDLIPGNHIQEDTMEGISRQLEEVKFSQSRQDYIMMPPLVVNDNGIQSIGETIWKLENGKFWRYQDEIQGVIIPMSCQGLIKNCRKWIVVKIERGSNKLEVNDSRKSVCSLAIIQKHLRQINEFSEGTIGKEFRVNKIETISKTNEVRDPEDCGVMAMLIVNHLGLELPGEPLFQIFAKDQINGQRYYTMFNLETGYMKMEIGKSGMALEEEEVARETERKNIMMWQKADEEMGTSHQYSTLTLIIGTKILSEEQKVYQWIRKTSNWKETSVKWQMRQSQKGTSSSMSLSITRLWMWWNKWRNLKTREESRRVTQQSSRIRRKPTRMGMVKSREIEENKGIGDRMIQVENRMALFHILLLFSLQSNFCNL